MGYVLAIGASTEIGSRVLNSIAAFLDKCLNVKSRWNTLKEQEMFVDAIEASANNLPIRDQMMQKLVNLCSF